MMWLYHVLTKNEAVYLFYLAPITYFTSIVVRLVYYKVKYHEKVALRDVMAMATMVVIVLDYVNYLYLLTSGTGKVLPISAIFIKYTFGFLLWAWMFWYGYHVHLKRRLINANLKKWRVVVACVVSVILILIVIGIVLS